MGMYGDISGVYSYIMKSSGGACVCAAHARVSSIEPGSVSDGHGCDDLHYREC